MPYFPFFFAKFFPVTNAMAVKLILNKEKYHQKFKNIYLQLEALDNLYLYLFTEAFVI